VPDRRVLVVEDDNDLRRFLVDALVDEGHDVREAAGGADALAILASWMPDLILLDISMPGMDGRTFRARQLRLPPPASQVPVVVVTGVHHYADLVAELGAAALLRKPFDLDALLALVEELPATGQAPTGAEGSHLPKPGWA